jgi:hypothetical protein
MNRTWAFSIAADVSTDDFGNSHLGTPGRCPSIDPGKPLLSFHRMAIPLFEESHAKDSFFSFVSKMLDALCSDWRMRLIGLSTYGAAKMTGCNSGFTTRLAGDVSGKFYLAWCLAHQLDFVIKLAMCDIFDRGQFLFMNTPKPWMGGCNGKRL